MPRMLTFLLLACAAGAASADAFHDRLKAANDRLRDGDPDAALTEYRDLQVDDPQSDEVHYGMGCAHYDAAMRLLENHAAEDAGAALKEAHAAFSEATDSPDAELRASAIYNQANCIAQQAIQAATTGDAKQAEKAFRESIDEYETILRRNPEHAGARQNLDHMRYLLKKMLQNPPPPQDNQEQEKNQKDQSQQDENNQQKSQDNTEDQQESGENQDEQKPDQQEERDPQSGQQEQPEEGSQEQQPSQTDPDQQNEQARAQQGEQEPQPLDRQSVEAILDSLEEIDHQEQQQVRTGPIDNRLRRDWW